MADERLKAWIRQARADLAAGRGETGEGLLRKVDGTTPTTDPTTVSYRYPFRDAGGKDVAPRDWTAGDWDAYQGNAAGVAAAVDRFLRSVENRRQRARGRT
jgi:hypothetical protein